MVSSCCAKAVHLTPRFHRPELPAKVEMGRLRRPESG